MAQANVKLTVDATSATRALNGVQNQSNQLQKSFGGLKTAIAGIGFTVLAKNVISTTANFKTLQLRMKGLTSEYGEFSQVQELVTKAQDKFNLSIVEATKSVTDIFARLRPLGIELKEIETAFMGFNTIAVAAGLNANEMNAAFTQLAQGLGSGQLQGDEFRSIAEQIPQLLSAISKETGIAEGKLKSFASKGLLKTDIIIRALAKSTEKYQDTVDNIIKNSPEAAFKAFSNAALELQLTLGDKLLPSVIAITKASTELIQLITNFVDSEAGQVTLAFIGIAAAIKGVTVVGTILATQISLLKASFFSMSMAAAAANGTLATTTTMAFATAGGFAKATAAANAFKIALAKTGIGLAVIAFGLLTTEILKVINAQKEFNKILEKGSAAEIEERIKKTTKTIESLEKQIEKIKGNAKKLNFELISGTEHLEQAVKKAREELERLQTRLPMIQGVELFREFEKAKDALIEKNKQLKETEKRLKIGTEEGRKQFDLEKRKAELVEKYGEELAQQILDQEAANKKIEESIELIKEKNKKAKKLEETIKAIGEEIEANIKDNLADAIMGAQSFGDAMNNVLNKIKRKLLDLALDKLFEGFQDGFNQKESKGAGGILGGIIGGIFKANGGPVKAGQPYIVGERRPELFVPNRSGTILPSVPTGGGSTNIVNVSVNASGTAVQGDNANAAQLGQTIANVVKEVIIDEQRSGGLLA